MGMLLIRNTADVDLNTFKNFNFSTAKAVLYFLLTLGPR